MPRDTRHLPCDMRQTTSPMQFVTNVSNAICLNFSQMSFVPICPKYLTCHLSQFVPNISHVICFNLSQTAFVGKIRKFIYILTQHAYNLSRIALVSNGSTTLVPGGGRLQSPPLPQIIFPRTILNNINNHILISFGMILRMSLFFKKR